MKTILFLLLVLPALVVAQRSTGRFEKDTLYTSNGFKIYKGQTLHFNKGTAPNGSFRYINVKSDHAGSLLMNNDMLVKKVRNFGLSVLGNGYIDIVGSVKFSDGSKGLVTIHMAFDHVLEYAEGLPGELEVPDEFKVFKKQMVGTELEKLYRLYKDSVITKEEFDAQKKKLLGN